MKRYLLLAVLFSILFGASSLSGSTLNAVDRTPVFGFKLMAGGRYDNMRMCVASPAGAKGGPVADVLLFMRFKLSPHFGLSISIPVFRPIFFGAAFGMLQYESDVALEWSFPVSQSVDFVTGPGIGISYHYGPDYTVGKNDVNPEKFFALGPMISYYAAFDFRWPKNHATRVGIHLYHISLFRTDESGYGMVFGGALEVGMHF